jgi:LCCL domain/Cohesin domain
MKKTLCRWLLAITLLAMMPLVNIVHAQGPNPWDTPQGQSCFEQWISVSMSKLNAYDGSADFNGRKPWSINRYGVLEGRPGVGPTSVRAPDNFPQYNNNKYWWMWDAWIPTGPNVTWTYPEWNGAGIENIQSFVTTCVAKSGGPPTGITPPSGGPPPGGGTPTPATWSTQPNSLPGGGTLRGRNGERFSFTCPPGGTISSRLWGTDLYTDDSSICTAAVHAGLITTARGGTVTIEIRPGASSYTGSPRNGVTSASWGSWDGSFVFIGGPPGGPPPVPQPNTNVTNMTIQAAQRGVIAGDLVLVPVWLIMANNVANINFQIKYNANIVKPEGTLTKGDLLDNALFSVNPNQSGNILSGFAQTSGLSGTGTVLNIPFRAIGKPGDRTTIDVTVTTINDPNGGNLAIDRIPGEIVIYNKDGTLPPGVVPSPGVIPPPPNILLGDCDGDGSLTESDALCALEMSVQLRPTNQIMDMDQSGAVDSRDAVIILQRALKK